MTRRSEARSPAHAMSDEVMGVVAARPPKVYNGRAWSLPTTEVGPTGLWEMASLLGDGQDPMRSSPESPMPSSKAPPEPDDRAAAAVLAHIARAAEALRADIRRLRAAAALPHLHFQLGREQLAAAPEPEPTTMETY